MSSVAVIDYGMGNLHSIAKALQHAEPDVDVKIVADADQILQADRVVFPGVGAMRDCMQALNQSDLSDVIQCAAKTKPLLGICLGMQILFESSEEGQEAGLGIIKGQVKRFSHEPNLTIPHMGWNQLELRQTDCPLWQDLGTSPWMYFVHSYYTSPIDSSVTAATTTHGSQTVTVAIAKDNVMAVQFHPEKSSNDGIHLLSNFVRMISA